MQIPSWHSRNGFEPQDWTGRKSWDWQWNFGKVLNACHSVHVFCICALFYLDCFHRIYSTNIWHCFGSAGAVRCAFWLARGFQQCSSHQHTSRQREAWQVESVHALASSIYRIWIWFILFILSIHMIHIIHMIQMDALCYSFLIFSSSAGCTLPLYHFKMRGKKSRTNERWKLSNLGLLRLFKTQEEDEWLGQILAIEVSFLTKVPMKSNDSM